MSKDIDIKKILEEISTMKTKFFVDPPKIPVDKEFLKEDKKRILMEAPVATFPPTAAFQQSPEIVVPRQPSANKNLRVAVNCITGERIVSPSIVIEQREETPNVESWFQQNKTLSEQKKQNWIDACTYYYQAKVLINLDAYNDWKKIQGKTSIKEPFLGNNKVDTITDKHQIKWMQKCLQLCFANQNQFEVGCAVRFSVVDFQELLSGPSFEEYIGDEFDSDEIDRMTDYGGPPLVDPKLKLPKPIKGDGEKKVITLTYQDWWETYRRNYVIVKKEIDSYLLAKNNGKLQEGWWEQMPNFFKENWQNGVVEPWVSMNIEKWSYSLKVDKNTWEKIDILSLQLLNPGTGSQGQTFYKYLPLTKEELRQRNEENPYNEDGTLKLGSGEYICMRPDASQVNYRSTAEVNEDKGMFDPYDNWIAWGSSAIVGKLIKSYHDVGWSVNNERVDYNDCYDDMGKLTCDAIPKRVDQYWYKVELFQSVTDTYDTQNTYKEVWVSSQTTEYCTMDKGDTQVSGTSYDEQAVLTVPMIPLKNPLKQSLQWVSVETPFRSKVTSNLRRDPVSGDIHDKDGRVIRFGGPKF